MNSSLLPGSHSSGLLKRHGGLLVGVLRLIDMLLVALAGWVAYWLYSGSPDLPASYELALLIGTLVAAGVLPRFGVYRVWRGGALLDELQRLTVAWMMVVTLLAILAFITKTGSSYSRLWGGGWAVLAWLLLFSSRVVLWSSLNWLRSRGRNIRRVLVVGAEGLGRQVVRRLESEPWTGLQVVELFCEQALQEERGLPAAAGVGEAGNLAEYVEREGIDQVWLALPLSYEARILEILHDLRHSTVDVRLVPELSGLRLLNRSITEVAGFPVVELSVSAMSGENRLVKAVEDRALALLILLLISPLLLGIAVAIKLTSPGPVLFKQRRHGWGGREIEVYKFRSMEHAPNEAAVQARKNDPRVTRVGAFLRRTSLDELPQFINVLQGCMSIVGPRPHPIWLNHQHMEQIDAYMQRHKVKPGITGWAQVNGYRGETDTLEKMQKRVEYDLYYIEHWSLWFDIRIILMTIFKGFVNPNAY